MRIVVFGAGALGSNVVENLCRMGYGAVDSSPALRVVDFDRVEQKNLGTQVYGVRDVGALKVQALAERMYEINEAELEDVSSRVDSGNIGTVADGAGLMVDCFDNWPSRRVIHEYSAESGIPAVHGGLNERYGVVQWSPEYRLRETAQGDADGPCEENLERGLVAMTAAVLSEAVARYVADQEFRLSRRVLMGDVIVQA